MKYGILEYKNSNIINIGDAMQILAVKNLYKQCGILEKEIVRVNYTQLQSYHGESVLLPICFPFYGYNKENQITMFSEDIIPLFLSLSLFDCSLSLEEIAYLKRYEPIGCRDAYTAKGLSVHGIRTYLNGCMTLTLDVETNRVKPEKIYCIDIPKDFIEKKIPENWKQEIVFKSHIFKECSLRTDEFAMELLKDYKENAKMVITSRLHAALPAYALGIPVILIHSEYSYRFSWLEDILHIYLEDEWDKIDWNGDKIYENEKAKYIRERIVSLAKARIFNKKEVAEKEIKELERLYETRKEHIYTRGPYDLTIKYLKEHIDVSQKFPYAIWGVSQVATSVINYMKENYPNAELVTVFDAKKKKMFMGHVPCKIESYEGIENLFVFVTADAVNFYASDFFEKIGKKPSTYFFCWGHLKLENCGGGVYQMFRIEK